MPWTDEHVKPRAGREGPARRLKGGGSPTERLEVERLEQRSDPTGLAGSGAPVLSDAGTRRVGVTTEETTSRAEAARLELRFHCVHCGGPVALGEAEVSARCSHCGSRLFVQHEGREDTCWTECFVRTPEDVVEVWLQRRVGELRARLCTEMRDANGHHVQSVEPPFLQSRLEAAAASWRRSARVGRRRLLWVPYWHHHGLVVQGMLGRERRGRKLAEVRGFVLEHTQPAYDRELFDFRDRGLRLGVARLGLLTRGIVESGFPALPARPPTAEAEEEIRRWCRRPLVPNLRPLTHRGEHVGARRMLVFKPFWVAELSDGSRGGCVLVDAQTSMLAGELAPHEVPCLLEAQTEDPLSRRRASSVVLLASRCVECGRDLPHEPRAWRRTCSQCHVGLAVGGGGVERASYSHAEIEGAPRRPGWLPFWSFDFRLTTSRGLLLDRWEDVFEQLGLPPAVKAEPLVGDRLWVPAVRLLGTRRGDKAFRELCEWVHRRELRVIDEPIPPVGTGTIVSATLPEDEARELGKPVLYAVQDGPTTARLNARVMSELVDDATLELDVGRLVMVPFREDDERFETAGGEVEVPRVHVEGGDLVDALRRTVWDPE